MHRVPVAALFAVLIGGAVGTYAEYRSSRVAC